MLVTDSIDEIRSAVRLWKREKLSVAFVPTMGALHEGHLALIRQARREADRVVVSIFVNPEQFGPDEDYDRYPRRPDDDLKFCQKSRVSAVFMPDTSTIYPDEPVFSIGLNGLNRHMCGKSRPGFFEGVVLVVNKLFNIIEPDIALFGQKDIQQYLILERMAREFNHGVKLVMGRTIRAGDGLALSSRNAYLSNDERLLAPSLYRALTWVARQIEGGVHEPSLLITHQREELEAKGFRIDYFNLYDWKRIEPVDRLVAGERYILAGAVFLGSTRLIDNVLIDYQP